MKNIPVLLLPLLFLTSCLIPLPPTSPTLQPDRLKNKWDDRTIFKDGLVPAYQNILDGLPGASVYHLEFNIADDLYHVTGREEVRYTNNEAVNLNEVRMRLFPNILGGNMLVDEVELNGKIAIPSYSLRIGQNPVSTTTAGDQNSARNCSFCINPDSLNDSLLIIPFEKGLAPGQSVLLKMDFSLTIPESVKLNYGVQAYYDNVLALAHAYPMIAVYDDEGWNAEIPPQSGDVTYADMSFFVVKVTAPESVVLVASGREVQKETKDGKQIVTYAAGPVRDYYLAASPEYEVFTKDVNGVKLRFYTKDFLQDGAKSALDVAARAIKDYGERYAPYPYTELDFVSTPTLALGIEYPGMIAIAERIVLPDSDYLEATIAHEVGHQWYYNLVGNDQLDEPWLDESLSQFVTLQYFTDEYGAQAADGFRDDLLSRWAFIGNNPIPVGQPVAAYSNKEYSGIVYGRGALFFEALREKMGNKKFDAFMKDYVASNAWDISTTEKLRKKAEEHCGCDLTPLFKEWIY